jgi:hypothetical protein
VISFLAATPHPPSLFFPILQPIRTQISQLKKKNSEQYFLPLDAG